MRIVVLASGAFAEPTVRWLAHSGHEIGLVITQPARGSGRGRRATPTPVKVLAEELGLPIAEVENVNTPESIARIRELSPRVMLVIAFGQKLGSDLLGAAPGGAINLHASLLPKYRGAAPINWAIARGESQTGCTVFRIVNKMDAGPIFAQDATDIHPEETAGELHDRLADLGVQTVQAALAMFELDENAVGIPQDESLVSQAPKLKKSDGHINFAHPARDIFNRIRGMTPWPGATANFVSASGRREPVTIVRSLIASQTRASIGESALAPGTLDAEMQIVTADGLLEITDIQPASGRIMSWADFVNGRHVRPGDRFETPL
jgi:methionyl-tRNA formyltransferase